MLPAQRAGARGADPWHALHRETATKVEVKQDQDKRNAKKPQPS